ncbi:DNA mismatch repair endonuclease MutL [Aliikangiella sp. G2MR2-5]|uniref:DNA mismatch repair endonuclease MutL n=1 Tax=Aliikangiella sp. G2MR2-5 TaxID=2788943 RepID=UPI0018AB243C|nr:DNA mismatch repair endonuclease MutL [Aliikangiella sp. G2MR2-5]
MNNRIHLLDNRLANQIAAGEVVERPASVVKELVENSIDSGATRIEVDVERGGTRLIRITDNGSGIYKDDLKLALTRHATSKIRTNEDLHAIGSLGFRGEALASISSVSRLTLTSRPQSEPLAWQAIAQGREMNVDIQPASAAPGTRIEVADLFYNTPARLKFLRTEKTEFSHVEEVFKQHALANFGTAFVLKHNHKVIKRVPAVRDNSQKLKRIATICGKGFADNALPFLCDHEMMTVRGWLGRPEFHRSESDIQYVFVNGRPIKDKTVNHAIRQAYEGLLPPGRMATYVIFIEMDVSKVDVNVHPTKHEVRFDQQRLVHDLLAKSISDALQPETSALLVQNESNLSHGASIKPGIYSQPQSVFELQSGQFFSSKAEQMPPGEGRNFEKESFRNENLKENTFLNKNKPRGSSCQESEQKSSFSSPKVNFRASENLLNRVAENFSRSYFSQNQISQGESKLQASPVVDKSETTSSPEYIGTSLSVPPENSEFWPVFSVGENIWLTEKEGKTYAFNSRELLPAYLTASMTCVGEVVSVPLLFPLQQSFAPDWLEDFHFHQLLEKLGFICEQADAETLTIRSIPFWLEAVDNEPLFNFLNRWLEKVEFETLSQIKPAQLSSDELTSEQLYLNKASQFYDWLDLLVLDKALVNRLNHAYQKMIKNNESNELLTDEVFDIYRPIEASLFRNLWTKPKKSLEKAD